MRWEALRVGDRIHFHIDDAGSREVLGQARDGSIRGKRTGAGGKESLVVALDQGLSIEGKFLAEVLLTPRHRQTVWTILSSWIAVYLAPVPEFGTGEFKAVFAIAVLRRART